MCCVDKWLLIACYRSYVWVCGCWMCTVLRAGTIWILWISYASEVRILGIRFSNAINKTSVGNWEPIINSMKRTAQDTYVRELCLCQRIYAVQTYLLSTIWYCSQVIPVTTEYARQVRNAILWRIWNGEVLVFRLPTTTLQLEKTQGGLNLTDIKAECTTLFLTRSMKQRENNSTMIAAWIWLWEQFIAIANPPNLQFIPLKFEYFRLFSINGVTWNQI
jgi:hypothetical protein